MGEKYEKNKKKKKLRDFFFHMKNFGPTPKYRGIGDRGSTLPFGRVGESTFPTCREVTRGNRHISSTSGVFMVGPRLDIVGVWGCPIGPRQVPFRGVGGPPVPDTPGSRTVSQKKKKKISIFHSSRSLMPNMKLKTDLWLDAEYKTQD